MRSQSSIEFLMTYSFLFLMLALIISFVLFLATAPAASIPSQCSGFAGPTCNFVQVYSNKTLNYSLITLSITNSQSVPISISNVSMQFKASSAVGTCTPAFLYPGMRATCAASFKTASNPGTLIQGFYVVNAKYCNSGVSNLSRGNCAFEKVSYSGSFQASPVKKKAIVFSVVASRAPTNLQLLPSLTLCGAGFVCANTPVQPNNYTILQNSQWISNITGGVLSYAYATNTPMIGSNYIGLTYNAMPFPSALSALSNNNIACGSPYNSMLAIASTTLYISSAATSSVTIETGGAMQVLYNPGTTWNSIFGPGTWKSQAATQYGANTVTLSKGLYNLEVAWSNPCGGGLQVLKMTSIG